MTLVPEELDPNSELRRKARANVATFEPLTGDELAEISRLFAGTKRPGRCLPRGKAADGSRWASHADGGDSPAAPPATGSRRRRCHVRSAPRRPNRRGP